MKSTKPTGALKALVDAGKSPSRVLSSVDRWAIAQPGDTSRRMDVIHPSAMVKDDWCHREQYFLLTGVAPAPRFLTFKQQSVFQIGHDVHHRWQNTFQAMGNLYGLWQCDGCRHTHFGLEPHLCISCESPRFHYREVPVHNTDLRISGHADGWLKGFGGDLLLEIKSIGSGTINWEDPQAWYSANRDFATAWTNIKSPFYSHVMQVQVYLALLEGMYGEDAPKEAVFIYENKLTQEAKEFVVPKSSFGITHLFEAAENIVKAVEARTPVSCNINPGSSCKKCEPYKENQ